MTSTSGYLPPSAALHMVEAALTKIPLSAIDPELDEHLEFNLGSLRVTLRDAPEAKAHLDTIWAHIESMYKARDKSELDVVQQEGKAALDACGPLHEIITKHKLV